MSARTDEIEGLLAQQRKWGHAHAVLLRESDRRLALGEREAADHYAALARDAMVRIRSGSRRLAELAGASGSAGG